MTHDPSQRSSTADLSEALLVLHKVTVLQGNMEPSEVTNFLSKLSQIQQTPAVQRGDPAKLHNAAVIGCAEGLHEFRLASIP